ASRSTAATPSSRSAATWPGWTSCPPCASTPTDPPHPLSLDAEQAMPPRGATVRIRLDRLRRFLKDLDQGFLNQRDVPEVEAVLMQWRSRYLGYIRRRFVQYSRGAG